MVGNDQEISERKITLSNLRDPIKSELKQYRQFFKDAINTDVFFLDQILTYLLRTKGKELRPMLVFYAAKIMGEPTKATFVAATMVELLHTATLIHDDVVDKADERRGFFTINKIWNNKVAVLLGDYLLSRGLLIALDHDEYDLLKVLSSAVKRMSEGELRQLKASKLMNITEEKYFDIISGKTASLLSACCECAAVSMKTDTETREKFRQIGEYLGLAFQIRDDLFDYESSHRSGKSVGNDILERKVTLPLIYALRQVGRREEKRIRRIVKDREKSPDQVQEVISFVIEHKGDVYARTRMQEYVSKANHLIDSFGQTPEVHALKSLMRFVIERNK